MSRGICDHGNNAATCGACHVSLAALQRQHTRDAETIVRLDAEVARLWGLNDSWAESAHSYMTDADELRARLVSAQEAARSLVALVDCLGAFVDDNDPRAMAVAGPIGKAQADLWSALGMSTTDEVTRLQADIVNRCAVCGWTLAESVDKGCVRGNCSMRPRPRVLYAPERAAKEQADGK